MGRGARIRDATTRRRSVTPLDDDDVHPLGPSPRSSESTREWTRESTRDDRASRVIIVIFFFIIARDEKIIVIGANGKTGRRCVEYLRASTDASAIVACTRGGAYEGGAVDARVESAAVNVATRRWRSSRTRSRGQGVIFAASQSQSGGDASRVDRDGVISCARACLRAGVERFVVVSSGSVSKPSSPVYVFLNFFGGIMRNKILGEDAVRALYFDRDGQYYTVVRPGGLSEDPARGPSAPSSTRETR